MTPLMLRLGAMLLLAVPATARPDELFTMTPSSQVSLGESGDTFGMEMAARKKVVILLNPDGEDCTLRFQLNAGEAFRVFVRAGLDQTLACDVSLSEMGKGQSATFSSRCVAAEAFQRRCAP